MYNRALFPLKTLFDAWALICLGEVKVEVEVELEVESSMKSYGFLLSSCRSQDYMEFLFYLRNLLLNELHVVGFSFLLEVSELLLEQ